MHACSLSVPGSDMSLQVIYKELLPRSPRIIDPANPANNLLKSGFMRSEKENKWTPLVEKIHSLDLSPIIMQQHKRKFS